MKQYIAYMNRCIDLARMAQGQTSPNPLVGCVVVNPAGEIVAEGFHKKYGENHAERDALLKLDSAEGCTLFVNLEPCSHYGKTPPCADLIIQKGIKKVVYGMVDPNPLVAGNGIKKLKNAGIEVVGAFMENECRKLNEIFIKNQTEHKTFVAIKTATTIDGKISTHNGNSQWITSEPARQKARNLRQNYDAILTSSSTVIFDNPQMVHKTKIILDRELKTDINSKIYEQGEIYIFYNTGNPQNSERITYIQTQLKDDRLDIEFILKKLYDLGIMSVFVEAGGILNASFLPYADKFFHFVAPKILGDNSGKSCFMGETVDKISDCTDLKFESFEICEPDILLTYSK